MPSVTTGAFSFCYHLSGNGSTTFGIAAAGTGLSYQWQESTNGGTVWNTLCNTGVYTTVTTATMNLTSAPNTMNTYQYRCVVSGTCTPAATSAAATVNFNIVPSVSVQAPSPSTICAGSNTSFGITAAGTGLSTTNGRKARTAGQYRNTLSNGGIYASSYYRFLIPLRSHCGCMNTYQYRCVVSGTCTPAATSAAAAC